MCQQIFGASRVITIWVKQGRKILEKMVGENDVSFFRGYHLEGSHCYDIKFSDKRKIQ